MDVFVNEYLNEFSKIKNSLFSYDERHKLVEKYAWAIPNQEAIECIVKHSPVIELGAGTGYWAKLVKEAGGDINAYDTKPRGPNVVAWYDPKELGNFDNLTLFLCWPPYATSMAFNYLSSFKGKKVIYIGEGNGGCTADDSFHELLESDFEEIEMIEIPQWYGMHDYLSVWSRK